MEVSVDLTILWEQLALFHLFLSVEICQFQRELFVVSVDQATNRGQ